VLRFLEVETQARTKLRMCQWEQTRARGEATSFILFFWTNDVLGRGR